MRATALLVVAFALAACTRPASSERENDAAADEEPSEPKPKKRAAASASAVATAAATSWPNAGDGSAAQRWVKAIKAAKALGSESPIQTDDMIATYSENPVAADARFAGKPLVVIGVVTAIEVDPFSKLPQVVFKHRKNQMEFKQVRATMGDVDRPVAGAWKAGDVGAVACKAVKPFDGLLDIELVDCVPKPPAAK